MANHLYGGRPGATMAALGIAVFGLATMGPAAHGAEDDARLSGGRPDLRAPPPTTRIYQQKCAGCHTDAGLEMNGRIVPNSAALKAMQPEKLYEAMANGKMRTQAEGISDRDMRGIAEAITGKKLGGSTDTLIGAMKNNCTSNPPLPALNQSAAWNGWSPTANNARFQSADAAGLSAADVPKLKLKWAFGLPLGASSSSQPSVVAGRVFVGSDNATIYSLDAKTGCAYWSYRAKAPGRYAPIVAPISGHAGVKHAVYFATSNRIATALDAQTGKLLWETSIPGQHGLSGSSAYHDGRLYIPLTGTDVIGGFNPKAECCKSRGAVAALDANTGKILWKTEVIPEPLVNTGKNSLGTPVWGPSGAGVWNTPTIDAKRGVIYFGTGNSYGPKAASTSDSIMAVSMQDGSIKWWHQEFKSDAFMLGCPDKGPAGEICPEQIGEDWDFGGASVILQPLGNGKDVLVAAGKGGIAIALDPDQKGKLLWRTKLYDDTPPTADGLVLFGGTADGKRVYFPLQREGGGLKALQLATGKIDWDARLDTDRRGQIGAATGIPGVVFTGGWDGILRAVNMDGKVIWSFDTRRRFDAVNGVIAIGGSLGSPGPTIANGMMYVASGYTGFQNGTPGNVILAFGVE